MKNSIKKNYNTFSQFFRKKRRLLFNTLFSALLLTAPSGVFAQVSLSEQSTLDFQGYIRTGIGFSEGGENQEMFGAPGAASKYRLGNEADTSIELAFDYRQYLDGIGNEDGAYVQGYFMLDAYTVHGTEDSLGLSNVAQGYLNFANFFSSDISFWVGRRYYERQSTYMTDHFWLNTAQNGQGGAGIEGVHALNGELKVAVLRNEDDLGNDVVQSSNIDVRVLDIPVNLGGKLNLFSLYSKRHKQESLSLDDENGYAVGLWHQQSLFSGHAINTLRLIHRDGAAVPQGDFAPNPLINDATITNPTITEVGTDLVYEPNGDFAIGVTAVYQKREVTVSGSKIDSDWYSIGVRPNYFINDHLAWVLDLGYDRVKGDTNDGDLLKGTIALQLGKARGYWSRPVLRTFVTYALWDDDFQGAVGGDTYANDTNGWTAGIQGEWWW